MSNFTDPNEEARTHLGPFERTFETQVLISLAEIKGSITLIAEREKSTRNEVEALKLTERDKATRAEVEAIKTAVAERAKHVDRELARLAAHGNKGSGVAIAMAVLIPIVLTIIGWAYVIPSAL